MRRQLLYPCSLFSSFFQSLCVLGYALAPLLLASIIALILHPLYVRVPVSLACWAWSVWGKSQATGL